MRHKYDLNTTVWITKGKNAGHSATVIGHLSTNAAAYEKEYALFLQGSRVYYNESDLSKDKPHPTTRNELYNQLHTREVALLRDLRDKGLIEIKLPSRGELAAVTPSVMQQFSEIPEEKMLYLQTLGRLKRDNSPITGYINLEREAANSKNLLSELYAIYKELRERHYKGKRHVLEYEIERHLKGDE